MTESKDILKEAVTIAEALVEKTYFGASIPSWVAAAALALVTYLGLRFLKLLLSRRFRSASARHLGNTFFNVAVGLLDATARITMLGLALFVGAQVLPLEGRAQNIVEALGSLTLIVQAALWANAAIAVLLPMYLRSNADDPARTSALSLMHFLGMFLVWALALLLILSNLGIDITALIAGLGIGGIAIALAVQNVLGDLLSSLSIVLDKPFEVGDFIITGQDMGTVERIGIKTTRVRSISGEQLVFANSDLLSSRIRNFKRMYERRVVFSLGVVYQTDIEHLKAIPSLIREAIEAQEKTRFDRAHFNAYGDFSLNFEVVYFVLTPDFNAYMDIQQALNLRLFEEFAARGIEFAYPTQTLILDQQGSSN